MLLTNLPDYMLTTEGEVSSEVGFHIPNHILYRELAFPYYFREEDGVIIDSKGQLAVLTLDMLDSLEWEIIDEHSKVSKVGIKH